MSYAESISIFSFVCMCSQVFSSILSPNSYLSFPFNKTCNKQTNLYSHLSSTISYLLLVFIYWSCAQISVFLHKIIYIYIINTITSFYVKWFCFFVCWTRFIPLLGQLWVNEGFRLFDLGWFLFLMCKSLVRTTRQLPFFVLEGYCCSSKSTSSD